jgi:hypothetical protein
MSNKMLYILTLMVLSACIEPFELENNGYDRLLVVDGNLNNGPGPYVVKLSTSASIDRISYQPLTDCVVEIIDGADNSYLLSEIQAGQYETDSAAFIGQVGQSYQLRITTPDGKNYASSIDSIKPAVEINNVYAEYEEKTVFDSPILRYGYQFYLDATLPENEDQFLLWQLTSTYRFSADFKIFYYYDGSVKPFPKEDSLYYCYKTERVPGIFTLSTKALSSPEIKRKKLHYVDTRTKALTLRYSLLVNQYVVNEDAHDYWNSLNEINQSQGAVFAQQPYQVRGNIICTSDTTENVLGYFTVAGLSQKRVFVKWNDEYWAYPECVITDVEMMAYADIFRSRPSQWPILITQSAAGARAVVGQYCIDCRTTGAQLEKPSFWID